MLMEHNREVYGQLCRTLETSDSAIVVMGTGVGKTYVTKEYIEQHHIRALVLAPRKSICDSWEKATDCDTMTYQKFHNSYLYVDFSKYGAIVCDEVHHIGAQQWGEGVRFVLENHLSKVIGLTDNPVRFTDGCRDVGEEFFGGRYCRGETVSSAIEKGILNPVTYVGALFSADGLKDGFRGIPDKLYAKLDLAINNTPTVQDIIRSNMPEGKRKGIIFAQTIGEIQNAMNVIRSVYPDVPMKLVHSKMAQSAIDSAVGWFNGTDEGYICNVNMLVEGVHVKGVNTLFMLRRTESPNVFTQQIGRCLSASSKERSIVFDLVGNKNTLGVSYSRKNSALPKLMSDVFTTKISQQLIVKDYTSSIVEVLNEIHDELMFDPWSEEEDKIIKENYLSAGAEGVSKMIDRTIRAIRARAQKLGVIHNYMWKDDELEILRKYYPEEGWSVYKRLPGRNKYTVHSMAVKMGLKSCLKYWSEEDKKKLFDEWEKGTQLSEIKKMFPGKTGTQIGSQARFMGAKRPPLWNWSEEEDNIIRDGVAKGLSRIQIANLLPGRERKAVARRMKELKIGNPGNHYYSDEEIEILRNNIDMSVSDLEKLLPGRSKDSIVARRLQIRRKNNGQD